MGDLHWVFYFLFFWGKFHFGDLGNEVILKVMVDSSLVTTENISYTSIFSQTDNKHAYSNN